MATVTQSPEGNYLALTNINHPTNKTKILLQIQGCGQSVTFLCQFSIHENCKSSMQKVYDLIRSKESWSESLLPKNIDG